MRGLIRWEGGPPVADVHFNYGEYQGGNEENKEVAAAIDANANGVVVQEVNGDDVEWAPTCPQ